MKFIMKSGIKKIIIHQLIFLFTAGIIVFLTALYEKRTLPQELATTQRILCDGTFFAAVIFTFIGLMLFISHWGGFDSFSYIMSKLKNKNTESYFEYVRNRHANKKNPTVLFFTTGLVMLTASICMIL